jgi:ATP synthase F1 gamma subunit
MPGLKEVRIRIGSVKSTQQITNAMRMVAASKLRRAQNAIVRLRPYSAKLREIMQNLSSGRGDYRKRICRRAQAHADPAGGPHLQPRALRRI